jgi:uncharacterized protein (UPF0332 family)
MALSERLEIAFQRGARKLRYADTQVKEYGYYQGFCRDVFEGLFIPMKGMLAEAGYTDLAGEKTVIRLFRENFEKPLELKRQEQELMDQIREMKENERYGSRVSWTMEEFGNFMKSCLDLHRRIKRQAGDLIKPKEESE